IPPRRIVELHHRALKGEGPAGGGLDDLALRGPLVLAVAIVAIEGRAHHRAVEARVPLAGMAFLGPFAHAGHVRDGGVHQLGRRRGVASDELDGSLAARRSVARDPPQVEFLNTQPEVVGVEVTGRGDVSDRKVRIDAGYSHRSSSSRTDAASTTAPADPPDHNR